MNHSSLQKYVEISQKISGFITNNVSNDHKDQEVKNQVKYACNLFVHLDASIGKRSMITVKESETYSEHV